MSIGRAALWQALGEHPLMGPSLDYGLSGSAFVDHAIGRLEQAMEQSPDESLRVLYHSMQTEYPLHFSAGNRTRGRGMPLYKNPAHKAGNGF